MNITPFLSNPETTVTWKYILPAFFHIQTGTAALFYHRGMRMTRKIILIKDKIKDESPFAFTSENVAVKMKGQR